MTVLENITDFGSLFAELNAETGGVLSAAAIYLILIVSIILGLKTDRPLKAVFLGCAASSILSLILVMAGLLNPIHFYLLSVTTLILVVIIIAFNR